MGTDTKNISNVNGGYNGLVNIPKSVSFLTGLLGADSTGARVNQKTNQVNTNNRIETSDTLKRRNQGYRGL